MFNDSRLTDRWTAILSILLGGTKSYYVSSYLFVEE